MIPEARKERPPYSATVEIHGTAAMITTPATSAARYGQMALATRSGESPPMRHASGAEGRGHVALAAVATARAAAYLLTRTSRTAACRATYAGLACQC